MGSLSLILAFLHKKAGQAKTTLAVEIAAVLAYLYGIKTLFLDLDGQGSATKWIGGADERGIPNYERILDAHSAARLFWEGSLPDPKDVIYAVPQVPNLAIIQASRGLEEIEKTPEEKWPTLLPRPSKFIRSHCQGFQALVIDTPGKLQLMAQVAAMTANSIATPCKPEPMCTGELPEVKSFLQKMAALRQPNQEPLKWLGIIPSVIRNHIGAHKYGLGEMVGMFKFDAETGPNHVFSQHFLDRSKFINAPGLGVPYCVEAPTSDETKLVIAILEEIMKRSGQTLPAPVPLVRKKRKGG